MSITENYEGGSNLSLSEEELLAQKLDALEMKIMGASSEEKGALEAEKAGVEQKLADMGVTREAA